MTDTTLRDFLDKREAEIKELRAKLFVELKEIKAAKQAIDDNRDENKNQEEQRLTIKEMILSVLSELENGATAETIISLIAEKFGQEIPRTSLSPQLSRLKQEGKLYIHEVTGNWCIEQSPSLERGSQSDNNLFG